MIDILSLLMVALHHARHSPPSSKVTAKLPLIQIRHHYSYLRAELLQEPNCFLIGHAIAKWGRLYSAVHRAPQSVLRVLRLSCVLAFRFYFSDISSLWFFIAFKVVRINLYSDVYSVRKVFYSNRNLLDREQRVDLFELLIRKYRKMTEKSAFLEFVWLCDKKKAVNRWIC